MQNPRLGAAGPASTTATPPQPPHLLALFRLCDASDSRIQGVRTMVFRWSLGLELLMLNTRALLGERANDRSSAHPPGPVITLLAACMRRS